MLRPPIDNCNNLNISGPINLNKTDSKSETTIKVSPQLTHEDQTDNDNQQKMKIVTKSSNNRQNTNWDTSDKLETILPTSFNNKYKVGPIRDSFSNGHVRTASLGMVSKKWTNIVGYESDDEMELDGSWALKRKLNKRQGEPSGKKFAIRIDTSNDSTISKPQHPIINPITVVDRGRSHQSTRGWRGKESDWKPPP